MSIADQQPAVTDDRPTTATVAETARAAARLIVAANYLLTHPTATADEATAAAAHAMAQLGQSSESAV